MGFAPLDCWARLLLGNGAIARISPRYWLRIAGGLFTSSLGTMLTLPERLVLGLVGGNRAKRSSGAEPHVLVILGYYRSGTTHLHYVLSCDPGMVTPRWYQALAPQGFLLSWTVLRYLLVPFLSSTRPQDDVAYGPEYPAEDDFAVCNINCACAMPGRMVLPGEWAYYKRFHGLDGLTSGERARFDRAQRAFTWRLGMLNPLKRLLLKTPSHTARVRALVELYGERVKFVHISREAGAVVKSNVAMHRRFEPFLLQEHPGDEEITRRVVEEYDASERAFVRDAAELGAGRLSRVRYQDLIADPMGEIERVYRELGIELTDDARGRMLEYLRTVKAYRTASERAAKDAGESENRKEKSVSTGGTPVPLGPEAEGALAWMHDAFGHDRSAIPKVDVDSVAGGVSSVRAETLKGSSAAGTSLIAALWALAAWLVITYATGNRLDWLVWPTGAVIGLTALRSAGRGTMKLGLWCAVLTVLVVVVSAYPATWIADYRDRNPVPWYHVWLSTRRGVLAMNNWAWMILGVMTAYRFGSRAHVRPPGM